MPYTITEHNHIIVDIIVIVYDGKVPKVIITYLEYNNAINNNLAYDIYNL